MKKQLTRSRDDRWVSGVCGGIGRYTGVDPNLVRLATVVLTVLGFGSVLIAYLVAWVLMPITTGDGPTTRPVPGPPSR